MDNTLDTDRILPYLSPTSLFAEEEEAVKRRTSSNWVEYNNTSSRRESLRQWQEGDVDMNPESMNQVAITSRESMVVQQPEAITGGVKYVIPKLSKKGIQSNEVNELAAKVSPPARPILPKPPGIGLQNQRPPWNTSGLRPQKKKK